MLASADELHSVTLAGLRALMGLRLSHRWALTRPKFFFCPDEYQCQLPFIRMTQRPHRRSGCLRAVSPQIPGPLIVPSLWHRTRRARSSVRSNTNTLKYNMGGGGWASGIFVTDLQPTPIPARKLIEGWARQSFPHDHERNENGDADNEDASEPC